MTLRVHSPEATLRMLSMGQDGTPIPPKISESKERAEAVYAATERQYHHENMIECTVMDCLVSMKLAHYSLCGDWAEGIERIRWIDIPERNDITPEDVVRECVMSTESCFGNTGVEVLAAYLDACGHDQLLFRLGEACALHARVHFDDVVPMSAENIAVLDNPAEHYGTTDQQGLRDKLINRFALFVNQRSPQHIIRAMIANIEWSIGNPVTAIDEAGFAYCEATVEQFGLKLQMRHPDVNKPFEDFELWKATQLLEFLKQR